MIYLWIDPGSGIEYESHVSESGEHDCLQCEAKHFNVRGKFICHIAKSCPVGQHLKKTGQVWLFDAVDAKRRAEADCLRAPKTLA